MEIKINETLRWFRSNYKDELIQVHTIKGNTLEDCFRKVYAMRRSARYDSGRKYKFQDVSLEDKYNDWKQKNETIEMYYGSATVD